MGVLSEAEFGGPRVAIVGSGPAGFYLADALLKHEVPRVAVDVFERLPVPFGLLRYGVAPDHQRIKQVSSVFHRIAKQPGFRFIGNAEVGSAVSLEELLAHYHAVVLAYGAAHDRRLGIRGEELEGSIPASAFVAWYNGHPDFAEQRYELGAERAVVVGMGNVALDVARILVRDPLELAETDIAERALEALRQSRVREVMLLGRRGPAEAAFDLSELIAIARLPGVGVSVEGLFPSFDVGSLDNEKQRLVAYVSSLPRERTAGVERHVVLRFLASPSEIIGEGGRVRALEIERNALVPRDGGTSAVGTGEFERLPTGLVFRAIGYLGAGLPGIPFDSTRGVVPNQAGRVVDASGTPVLGLYAVGWIKRGAKGLIGSNKADAQETYQTMMSDLGSWAERHVAPRAQLLKRLSATRRLTSFEDHERIDALELERGRAKGKVRDKLVSLPELLEALER